jgi:hypothetical protein
MNSEPRWADRVVELRRERRDKVLELRGEGMTQREIADALGVSVGTVNGDLTGESVESAAEATVPQSKGNGTPERTPVERLSSGSLPPSAVVEEDLDAGRLADRILRRPF